MLRSNQRIVTIGWLRDRIRWVNSEYCDVLPLLAQHRRFCDIAEQDGKVFSAKSSLPPASYVDVGSTISGRPRDQQKTPVPLFFLASQWNTSPIYGKIGSVDRIEIAISAGLESVGVYAC